MVQQTDILVSGGGIAGLCSAIAFGSAGLTVICVDPAPPVTERDAEGSDLRTTAYLQPSRDLLDRIGLWPRLENEAMPLNVMRIVDGGDDGSIRATRDFAASDISQRPFGWNVPNWVARRKMLARLAEMPTVSFRAGTATRSVLTRHTEVRAWLTDGATVRCRMLVAADGRDSPVREALGIRARTIRYGRKALAFAVTHDQPHENVSIEVHRSGGPFTLVPLPDHEGRPSSAVVWLESGKEAHRLANLDRGSFEREMTRRSAGVLGDLKLATRLTLWPIISRIADRFAGARAALVAEAAHVLPPIGAQGLNMSLGDIAHLLEAVMADPENLGDQAMLDDYDRHRRAQVAARIAGVDLLSRVSSVGGSIARDMRLNGLIALHDLEPLRQTVMRLGLGTGPAQATSRATSQGTL